MSRSPADLDDVVSELSDQGATLNRIESLLEKLVTLLEKQELREALARKVA